MAAGSLAAWLRGQFRSSGSEPLLDRRHDLTWWRGRILRAVLIALAWFGTLAYIPSVLLCLRERLWLLAAIDTLALAGILALLGARTVSYAWRACGALAINYLLAVALIAEVAMTGAGLVWLAALPILTAILLGLRAALWSLGLCTLTCAIFTVTIATGRWQWSVSPTSVEQDLWTWVVDAVNALVVSGAISLAIATLLRGLQSTNRSLIDAIAGRERSEAERIGLEAQLRHAQKLEAGGRLAGGSRTTSTTCSCQCWSTATKCGASCRRAASRDSGSARCRSRPSVPDRSCSASSCSAAGPWSRARRCASRRSSATRAACCAPPYRR